ncbi:hypothetical protein IFM89_024243 [Coptis chinensis]|uniref:Small auxin up regulated protein n=1 Tax=Coptis chinensis TaxID=261450 RepID=A0A835LSM5_9MAGN|nr:hypothetical protein IFM89_024243 [Coptis chinensis]
MIWKWKKKRKGHFVVYAKEGKRFVVPLYYLNHPIFRVLLEMAEEEFGYTGHGPLQVPCEGGLMEYIISMLGKNPPLEVDKVVVSINSCRVASFFNILSLLHTNSKGGQDLRYFELGL